jgi:hypothetical protein
MFHIIQMLMGAAGSFWSTTDKSAGITLSDLNLTASAATNKDAVRGIVGHDAGKFCFEVSVTSIQQCLIGVASTAWSFSNFMGQQDSHSSAYFSSGNIYANSGTAVGGVPSYVNGAVIMVAADCNNRLSYFAKNGTWINSADPVAGTGGVSYVTSSLIYPAVQFPAAPPGIVTLNVGDTPFVHAAPTGYAPWG